MFEFIYKNRSIFLFVLLLFFVGLSAGLLRNSRKEKERHTNNYKALAAIVEVLTDKLGNEVAKVQALELGKREVEIIASEQAQLISDLNLKLKRAESITSTVIHTTDTVYIKVEAPIFTDTTTLLDFKHSDGWLSLEGKAVINHVKPAQSEIKLSYQVVDSLDVVIYREPRKFLFIRYGTKRYDCYVRSLNPHSHVVVNKCTIIKK